MKKYEGLIILDATATEDELKAVVDKVQKEIEGVGCRVEKVQKMDQRPFARTSGRRNSGYYVNYIFTGPPTAISELDAKFHLDPSVFRWQFTEAEPEEKERKPRRITVETESGTPRA